MRIGYKITIVILLLLSFAAACTSNEQNESNADAPKIDGPALVMFYTDN